MGSVTLNGATSGQITLQPTAVAGTNTATLPAGTGTIIETVTNMAANPVTGTPSSTTYLRGDGTWAAIATASQTTYTSGSGSWTKPSSGTYCLVRVWGAGGSGCRGSTIAAGGGGGAYAERLYLLSSLGATESYSVGAGGAALTANGDGNVGGNSTFGSGATLVTAYGGGGGSTSNTTAGATGNLFSAGGQATSIDASQPWFGGSGSGSNQAGKQGWMGGGGGGGAYQASSLATAGGASVGGGAGGAGSYTAAATAGTQPGGGGGGGSNQNSGKGGDGQIQIWVW